MVASVDSGNLQLFRLEPKSSADTPVTHNSEWNSSKIIDIPHVFVSVLVTQMRVAMVFDSQFTRPALL